MIYGKLNAVLCNIANALMLQRKNTFGDEERDESVYRLQHAQRAAVEAGAARYIWIRDTLPN